MFTLKWLCVFFILLSTLTAAIYPFLRKIKKTEDIDFAIGDALSSGIFLGAGLIHMLGDASHTFHELGYEYPFAFLLAGGTFLILLWFEHIGRHLYEHHYGRTSIEMVHLTVIMLSIHSFLEGTALGFSDSFSVMLIILIAILAHKWAASFALAVQLSKSTLTLKKGLILFAIFACMTPLGILLGASATDNVKECRLIEPIFISLASGTFLYLGTLHGLRRAVMVEKCCDLKCFGFVVVGFAIMAIVATYA